jgi:hypothetical protein
MDLVGSPVLPLRLVDRREEVLHVVGGLDVAGAAEVLLTGIPEPVRSPASMSVQ